MKTGRNLNEIALELQRQAASKKDYLADTRRLSLRPGTDGAMLLEGVNGGMPVRPTAHNQLASVLQIPKPYYDRMLEQAPDLLAQNANHWLHAGPGKKLIRTLDGGVRAFLSDRYRPLDNFDLAEAVLPKLFSLDAQVLSGEVTDRRFYLKAVTPKVQGEVKKGDVVQAGVVISNSEIGEGSLRVEELTYRLVCLNGAIHAAAVRKAHLGRGAGNGHDLLEDAQEYFRDETRAAADRAFWLQVQDASAAVLDGDRLRKRLLEYQGAAERKIEADPVEVVEVASKRFGLNDDERGNVLRHLIEGGDLSQYGLANAVTRASQDVDDYDRATELEGLGGKVVELKAPDWKALAGRN